MSRLHDTISSLGLPVSGLSTAIPVTYTPAVTWTGATITTIVGTYQKLPGVLVLWVTFTVSATPGGASALTIPLPSSFTIAALSAGALLRTDGSNLSLAQVTTAAVGASSFGGTPTSAVSTYAMTACVPING